MKTEIEYDLTKAYELGAKASKLAYESMIEMPDGHSDLRALSKHVALECLFTSAFRMGYEQREYNAKSITGFFMKQEDTT